MVEPGGGEGIFSNFDEATARADQAGGGNKLFKTRCEAQMFLKTRSSLPLRRSKRQTKIWFGAEAEAYDSWEIAFRACTNGQLPEPFEEHEHAVAWSQSNNGGGEAGQYLRATGVRACAGAGVYDAWESDMLCNNTNGGKKPKPFAEYAKAIKDLKDKVHIPCQIIPHQPFSNPPSTTHAHTRADTHVTLIYLIPHHPSLIPPHSFPPSPCPHTLP